MEQEIGLDPGHATKISMTKCVPPLDMHGQASSPLQSSPADESPLSENKEELKGFKRIFDENMKNKPVRHDKVAVLLLSWEEPIDDLKVQDEVAALKSMFEDTYGFEVQWKTLTYKTNQKPSDLLQVHLAKFKLAHNLPNTLLIIYYAGHGSYEDEGYEDEGNHHGLVLTASTSQSTKAEKRRNNIAWSGAERSIDDVDADVLVIFDCCGAGAFGGYRVRSSKPPFEFLAACGKREWTPKPGPKSFTSALLWALDELKNEPYFSSIELHTKIMQYPQLRKTQKPELLRRNEYADELVWIAPLKEISTGLKSPPGAYRDPRHEYLDLRLDFYRRVGEIDVKNTAKVLSKLVNDSHSWKEFEAKRIILLDKSSVHSKAVEAFRAPLKRKRSSLAVQRPKITSFCVNDEKDSTVIIEDEPRRKRPKQHDQATSVQGRGAFYHFRMFLDCSLQNMRIGIGRIADRVRPSLRERNATIEGTHATLQPNLP